MKSEMRNKITGFLSANIEEVPFLKEGAVNSVLHHSPLQSSALLFYSTDTD